MTLLLHCYYNDITLSLPCCYTVIALLLGCYQHDTKRGSRNGYFLHKYMSKPMFLSFNLSKKA